jgi:hypothetical protein
LGAARVLADQTSGRAKGAQLTPLELILMRALGGAGSTGGKMAARWVIGPADERRIAQLVRLSLRIAIERSDSPTNGALNASQHTEDVFERFLVEEQLDISTAASEEALTGLLAHAAQSSRYDLTTLPIDVSKVLREFLDELRKRMQAEASRHGSPLFEPVTQEHLVAIRHQVEQLALSHERYSTSAEAHRFPPRQAPSPPASGVIGRETDLKTLLDDLVGTQSGSVSLVGLGGIGKTTLAAAAARSRGATQRFTDGTLWVPVGPTPRVRPLRERVGRDLGIDLLPKPHVEDCVDALRDALFERRILLVLDDVWQVAHAEPLNIGGDECRLLITTRSEEVASTLSSRARTHSVNVLSSEASAELIHRLAPQLTELGTGAVANLCRRLEFHPLALTLAGRLLEAESAVPTRMAACFDALLNSADARLALSQTESRLGIDAESVSIRAILGLSIDHLNPTDRERFAMCAVLGGDPIIWTLDEATAVWACHSSDAEQTVRNFVRLGLAERRGGNYWMHALLHDYAYSLWKEEYSEEWVNGE